MEIVAENRVGRRIHKHIRSLAVPRFVGSAGEYEARRYIVEEFQNARYNVEERPFTASFFPLEILPRLIPAITVMVLVMGFFALPVVPLFSVEAGVLVLLLLFLSSRWHRSAERMYRFRSFGTLRSKNILASHPEDTNLLTIVFTAHYDSKSQNWSGPVRTLLFGSLACTAAFTSLLLIVCAIVPLPRQVLLPGVFLSTLLFLPCLATTSGNESPGAYDNASGVALLLELARSFAGESPAVNLHFIATGGEEAGLCGAVALVNDPSFRQVCPPARTIIVNLDGIGSKGPLRITDRFGIPPVRTGP
ncbi:MAG: M28 family peptidase, partial [Bacteroidota bacterium]|nr:M28 family peptidase [Bacteroidota bacterium]